MPSPTTSHHGGSGAPGTRWKSHLSPPWSSGSLGRKGSSEAIFSLLCLPRFQAFCKHFCSPHVLAASPLSLFLLSLNFSGSEDVARYKVGAGGTGPEKGSAFQGKYQLHGPAVALRQADKQAVGTPASGRRCRDNLAGGLVTPRSVAMVTWFFL